jgi:hypothetical protein
MSAPRDLDRQIQSFLAEGPLELPDASYDEVRDRMEQKRQRADFGRWRTSLMSRNLMYGMTVAAGVLVVVIGYQLIGGSNPGGPAATETPQPSVSSEPASAEPSTPADSSLPVGRHVMVSTVGLNEDRVTVNIPGPGWFAEPGEGSLTKDLGGDDRVTVVTVPGDHYRVPRNICNWQGTDDPGYRSAEGSVDNLVAYLAEQTYDAPGSRTRDLSAPVAITLGGHPGQSITGAVPGSDPDGCDQQRFCSLLDRDGDQCLLPHLEPNALVTLWISAPPDRNPPLWVVAASYWPATGSELRAEMNAIVDSMTIIHE